MIESVQSAASASSATTTSALPSVVCIDSGDLHAYHGTPARSTASTAKEISSPGTSTPRSISTYA